MDNHKSLVPAASPNSNLASAFTPLKWKRKRIWCLLAFNALLFFLLVLDRIIAAQSQSYHHTHPYTVAAAGLPTVGTLLAIYMCAAIREHKSYREIIKPNRSKYFILGTSLSTISFLITLLALVMGANLNADQATIIIYCAMSFCALIGITSSVVISIYEFCVCFDIYYHKNKNQLVEELIKKQTNLKIVKE